MPQVLTFADGKLFGGQLENPIAVIEWSGDTRGNGEPNCGECLHGIDSRMMLWNGANGVEQWLSLLPLFGRNGQWQLIGHFQHS